MTCSRIIFQYLVASIVNVTEKERYQNLESKEVLKMPKKFQEMYKELPNLTKIGYKKTT